MKPIPVSAAKEIAKLYGYDQIVIVGRKVGSDPEPNGEHCTTYGADATHCSIAARIGRALQRFMQWPLTPADPIVEALDASVKALRSYEFGNASPDLARSIADAGDAALIAAKLQPATLGAVAPEGAR